MFWVLVVFINGQPAPYSEISFSDLDSCLEIQAKLRNQAMHMERAGDKSPQFWCLPREKDKGE